MKTYRQKLTIFLFEGIIIFFVLALGIFVAKKASLIIFTQQIQPFQFSLPEFLFLFFLGTGLILLLTYFSKLKKIQGKFFKGIYYFSGGWGILVTFSFLFSFFSESFLLNNVLPLVFSFGLLFWRLKSKSVLSHNVFFVFGLVGLSSVLGLSFQPQTLMFILAFLCIYDFIAVYKTKHMQKMAKAMLKSGTMMGLIIPHKISETKISVEKIEPGEKFLILGGGDIAFPLIFLSSLVPLYHFQKVLVVALFAFFGILFTLFLFLSQKQRKPMPALPPIIFFTFLGYLFITT